MPIYYRGPAVQITHREFTRFGPTAQTFAIRELHEVHIVITEASGATPRLTYSASAAAAAVAVTGWPLLGSAPVTVTGLVALAVLSSQTAGCLRGRHHSLELHAYYHAKRVCLFRTTDPRLFGQIRRALVRALEADAGHYVSP